MFKKNKFHYILFLKKAMEVVVDMIKTKRAVFKKSGWQHSLQTQLCDLSHRLTVESQMKEIVPPRRCTPHKNDKKGDKKGGKGDD